MTIQAIETEYAGHRFRSRLEARWAVFFDAVGNQWEYEPQGYEIDGVRYLPDFYLPEARSFVEVKGALDAESADKVLRLARATRQPVWLLEDIPAPNCGGPDFHVVDAEVEIERAVAVRRVAVIGSPGRSVLVPFGWPLVVKDVDDPGVAKTLPDLLADRDLKRSDGWVRRPQWLEDAYTAARQARFEHGETGARH